MNLEESLRSQKPQAEAPPFLRIRIMNSIEAAEVAKSRACGRVRRFYAAFGLVAVAIAIAIAITVQNRPSQPQQVAIEIPSIPKISIPAENSLQSEMENLKADTRNAARALAANFLPSQP
jgi:hypothetical protein